VGWRWDRACLDRAARGAGDTSLPRRRAGGDGEIVNAAAVAYRGVIPETAGTSRTCRRRARGEIAAGVEFWGYEDDGELIGVMGIQPVRTSR
jgi:hypothetical protein